MRFVGGNMKITKQVKGALLVLFLAISILPGCGKSKNDGATGVLIGTSGYSYTNGGAGGCATVSMSGDGTMTFPVQGTAAYIGATGFSGNTYVGGSGYTGGNYYRRVNYSGDEINLSINGSVISATVRLSNITVTALGGSIQPLCIVGIQFNNTGVTAGSPGTLYGGITLYTSNATVGL